MNILTLNQIPNYCCCLYFKMYCYIMLNSSNGTAMGLLRVVYVSKA